MTSTPKRILIPTLAILLIAGTLAWAGEEENVWVQADGKTVTLHSDQNAMFISDDGVTFDLSDLLPGETRQFGEGAKQVTATRVGDAVTIQRLATGTEGSLEFQCELNRDTCKVITFADNPEKVMIMVEKTRECVNGVGDCDATLDVTLDDLNLGEGAHAIIKMVKCDDTGNCEETEEIHGSHSVEVSADVVGGEHPKMVFVHAAAADGKVKLVCPEGDATIRVNAEQADDTFLCPQHSIPMEKAEEHGVVRRIKIEKQD